MHSNKSRAIRNRIALQPQRRHGKLRVAALLEAGADVIAEKGFQAATMTEIAAKAGAPIGSLYRFFPNKEILADALVQRYGELVDDTFAKINSQIKSLSTAALAEGLLNIMADFHREKRAIRALLEAQSDSSAKREGFRTAMRRRVAKTLRLRNPRLDPDLAMDMAVVVIQNMKTVVALNQELRDSALSGALAELRQMTRLYLEARLGD
ncbi:MAG TPA: TetR/AcrR family transcriptional regulator [Chthoniobacterales bacterium]|jgi:AcrR family transcriptional regulator|nr:TetR/AcrR family transcriptional regulator [Chthoniobacterales bacterium]